MPRLQPSLLTASVAARPRLRFAAALASTALAVLPTACRFTEPAVPAYPEVEFRQSAAPARAYRLTMTIENAPGPFAMVEGSAQYDVENHHECGYLDPATELVSRINTHPPLNWRALGDGAYTTTVYLDLMVDEAYYGREVCRWTLTAASALLRATGDEAETRFLPSISGEDIVEGNTVNLYFPNARYPRSGVPDFADLGHTDPDRYKPEIQKDLFVIRIMSEQVSP